MSSSRPDTVLRAINPLYSGKRSSSILIPSSPRTRRAVDRASEMVGDGPVTAVSSAPSAGDPVRGSIM